MNRMGLLGFAILLAAAMSCPAAAASADDACAMVDQALTMYKEKGKDATLAAMNDKNGPFVKGELYVFAMAMDGLVMAHPIDHTIRKLNLRNLKDNNGTPFIRNFAEVAERHGEGWVEYMWVKRGAEKQSKKRTFVKRVPGENLLFAAGYYVD